MVPNFWQLTKRMNSNMIGIVSGSDFKHPSMPYCYIGRAENGKILGFIQRYSFNKLMIYGEKIDDFIFSHEDIQESKVLESNVRFNALGKNLIGTKYEVSFLNGKKAIIYITQNNITISDNVLL